MRMPRIEHPGARHHVMNRGSRRQPVFADDVARELFLALLADLPQRFGVRVHGYALMPNHYHLMLESVRGELARAMRHLGSEYTRRENARHGWDGPLFRGRYRNRVVATDEYWTHLLVYLHLNPVRARLPSAELAPWTSHRAYLRDDERPQWLTTSELQRSFGGPGAYLSYFEGVRSGKEPEPADFDGAKLWAPDSTGSVAVPDLNKSLWRVGDALADVCEVTGLPLETVLTAPRGRVSNPANWLAAWWLSRGCGLAHGEIKAALVTSHSGVSKRIAQVQRRLPGDVQLRTWIAALRQRQRPDDAGDGGAKVESGNT